ncbi:hypothetical protein CAPTEDRAFT_198410 [Capitella teleta]|uniref:G-protein coupled receptors family 1 profile domain-containing protein n=1 Tax=Capitella teleta TaxID=283909 RepID=R7TKC0_CAPTE|nr:hypothetical protein CAPTEDRAFT_198410 [Capitella teleta]|eukprot:ELT91560.1 hypothetical protein CAPTEDRAFT_198410 [Capitella teleta]
MADDQTTHGAYPTTTIPEADLGFYRGTMVFVYGQLAVTLITIVINPMTVMAMFYYKMLKKTATNLFIVSLCGSDSFLGLGAFLLKISHCMFLLDVTTPSVKVCSWFAGVLICIAFFASLLNVILIGVDRALATVVPLKHRTLMTVNRSMLVLAIMWVFISFLTFVPLTLKLWGTHSPSDLSVIIYPTEIFPPNYTLHFTTPYIMTCIAGSAILYGSVVFFYFKAAKRMKKQSTAKEKRGQQMTRMVIIIVVIIVVFNSPIVVLGAMPPPDAQATPAEYGVHHFIYELCHFCMIVPTFINNFIYAWHLEEFRRAYIKLLRCGHVSAVNPTIPTSTTY